MKTESCSFSVYETVEIRRNEEWTLRGDREEEETKGTVPLKPRDEGFPRRGAGEPEDADEK